MSISLIINDRQIEIEEALEQRDAEKMYQLARLEANDGNHEEAFDLLKLARRWDREDAMYDEANGN